MWRGKTIPHGGGIGPYVQRQWSERGRRRLEPAREWTGARKNCVMDVASIRIRNRWSIWQRDGGGKIREEKQEIDSQGEASARKRQGARGGGDWIGVWGFRRDSGTARDKGGSVAGGRTGLLSSSAQTAEDIRYASTAPLRCRCRLTLHVLRLISSSMFVGKSFVRGNGHGQKLKTQIPESHEGS